MLLLLRLSLQRNNDSEDELDCGKRRVRATRSPRKKKPRRCIKLEPEVSDRINEVIDQVVTGAMENNEEQIEMKIEVEEEKIMVPAFDSESGEWCMLFLPLLFFLDVFNMLSKNRTLILHFC